MIKREPLYEKEMTALVEIQKVVIDYYNSSRKIIKYTVEGVRYITAPYLEELQKRK